MLTKGRGDLVLLILVPTFIIISAGVTILFANAICQSLPENCGYITWIAYTLIGAMVFGAVVFFKNKFFV
jgi:hypothetical protein